MPAFDAALQTTPAHPAAALRCATTDEIDQLIAAGAPIAIGVSGGKDSHAAALAVVAHLRQYAITGPVLLVHAHLGRVEWSDSLPTCEALAQYLGLELLVVKRQAGDLMDRWLSRWDNSVRRYAHLECMKLIPPWSTSALRFCTSELKVDPITSALRRRFPRGPIINVAGVRAEESAQRAKMPIAKRQDKLCRKHGVGIQWHPILHATKDEVLASIASHGLALHPAYTEFGMSRVSCRFCILGSIGDIRRAAAAPEATELYREICELEIRSTFSFQSGRYLSTISAGALGHDGPARVTAMLARATRRTQAEAKLPSDLLYQEGWPTRVPSQDEASVLAAVRREVADSVEIPVMYSTASEVRDRIFELISGRDAKAAAKFTQR